MDRKTRNTRLLATLPLFATDLCELAWRQTQQYPPEYAWIKGHLWDALLGAVWMLYYPAIAEPRDNATPTRQQRITRYLVTPIVGFGILSTGELAQKIGAYPGTYDPQDFLAYGVGVICGTALSAAIDHTIATRNKREKQELSDRLTP